MAGLKHTNSCKVLRAAVTEEVPRVLAVTAVTVVTVTVVPWGTALMQSFTAACL